MELKDWLNSINFTKENLFEDEPEAKYPAFVVNKCLSGSLDSVLFANEMNKSHFLDKRMQYDFFINIVRSRKRFSPWDKKQTVKDLDLVKKYYGYSNDKAIQALRILTPDQLNYIKDKLNKGGKTR